MGQGSHSLLEWVTAAICAVWADAGVFQTLSKWQSFADLEQILQEMGMRPAMFKRNTQGPDDECFTEGMQDLVSQHIPSSLFGSLIAISASYVGCHINGITTMVVSFGRVESHRQ